MTLAACLKGSRPGSARSRRSLLEALQEHPARHPVPVDLGDLPGLAQVGAEVRVGGQVRGAHGDAVGLDVVGVAVSAVGVIGDEDLGAYLADHPDQVGGGLVDVGGPEGTGPLVLLDTHHPGVAVAAGAAEEAVVGDAELLHGLGQLVHPVRAQRVVTVGREVGETGRDDLALFAEGAGHQRHPRSLGRVLGHGRAVVDRLVVRVRVHQEQSAGDARGVFPGRRPGRADPSWGPPYEALGPRPCRARSFTGTVGRGGRGPGGTGPGTDPGGRRSQNLILPIMPAMLVVSSLIVGAMVEEAR